MAGSGKSASGDGKKNFGSESEDNKGGSLGGAGMGPARRASKFNPTTILGKNSKNGSDKTMQENLRSAEERV